MTMSHNGLSKLTEEIGELGQVIGKVLAFGLYAHPDGTASMKRRLEEELADVEAALHFVREALDLDQAFTCQRASEKLELFRKWHKGANS